MIRQALILLRSDVMAVLSRIGPSNATERMVVVGIAAAAAVPTAVLIGAVLVVVLPQESVPGATLLIPVVTVVAFLSISIATGARLIRWSTRPDLPYLQVIPGALGASIVSEGLLRPLLVGGGLSVVVCVTGMASTLFSSTISGADVIVVLLLGPVLSAVLLTWSAVAGLLLAVALARLPRTLRTTLWLAGYLPALTVFWGLLARSVFTGSGGDVYRAGLGRFPRDPIGQFGLAASATVIAALGAVTLRFLLRGSMPRRALGINAAGRQRQSRQFGPDPVRRTGLVC